MRPASVNIIHVIFIRVNLFPTILFCHMNTTRMVCSFNLMIPDCSQQIIIMWQESWIAIAPIFVRNRTVQGNGYRPNARGGIITARQQSTPSSPTGAASASARRTLAPPREGQRRAPATLAGFGWAANPLNVPHRKSHPPGCGSARRSPRPGAPHPRQPTTAAGSAGLGSVPALPTRVRWLRPGRPELGLQSGTARGRGSQTAATRHRGGRAGDTSEIRRPGPHRRRDRPPPRRDRPPARSGPSPAAPPPPPRRRARCGPAMPWLDYSYDEWGRLDCYCRHQRRARATLGPGPFRVALQESFCSSLTPLPSPTPYAAPPPPTHTHTQSVTQTDHSQSLTTH